MNETGPVQMHCGDGKEKTITTIGAAVRAVGRGYRVLVVRLLEIDDSGGVTGPPHTPGATVLSCGRSFEFSWSMTQVQRKIAALHHDHCLLNTWNTALGADGGGPYDMLMLGEAIGACNLGFAGEADLVKVLKEKPAALEVILTGRCPSEALRDQADYITEIVMRHHPHGHGVEVKEGAEYQRMNVRGYVLAF